MSGRRDLVPFAGLRATHPPSAACQLDAYFPEYTAGEWRLIALQERERVDLLNDFDPLDYPEPPKRHQPSGKGSTPAAIPHEPTAVELSMDPLKKIAPRTYIEALCGEVPDARGWMCCPLPDHDDTSPSFQVLATHWRCFGCNRGGSVIDFAAALWGIVPRGGGYLEIRRRLLADLGIGGPV